MTVQDFLETWIIDPADRAGARRDLEALIKINKTPHYFSDKDSPFKLWPSKPDRFTLCIKSGPGFDFLSFDSLRTAEFARSTLNLRLFDFYKSLEIE